MDRNIKYFKVKKIDGQNFFKQIKTNVEIIDKSKKVLYEDDYILFPILNENQSSKIIENQNIEFEIIEAKGVENDNFKFKSLKDALKNSLPKNLFCYIPNSYDII